MKKYRFYIIAIFIIIAFLISICFIPISASRLIPVVEKQVAEDLGIQVHIDKLILRLGPTLKIKTPIMHMMYSDGQKFGQFDNVKLYVGWISLIRDDVTIKKLYANNLILKTSSCDKYLPDLTKRIRKMPFSNNPNIYLKEYSFNYKDIENDKMYKFAGKDLSLDKIVNYENFKVKTEGDFFINDKKYVKYDISLLPNFKLTNFDKSEFDLKQFAEQLIALDFYSDIITDLKLSKNSNNELQISGLVNIDNISVLDPQKKEPKSFVYLTFLGNKVGILSNLYASNNKKVCLEGVINNSTKPEIDLKVKTDEINLAQLFKKIKLFIDCSKYKEIESLDGELMADFNLKGDLNKIKSSGYFKVNNGSIRANGVNINKISTNIDMSNNIIQIVDAIGYVNNSPILAKGKIDKNINIEVLMDKVELKKLLPSNFGVKSGVLSLVANIYGTPNNIQHKENVQIDNLLASSEKGKLAISSAKIDTNKENIAYINNIIITPVNTESIKIPLLKLYIEPEKIKVPDTNIFMQNSKLKAKAEISDYNSSNYTFNTNIDGYINTKDLRISNIDIINCPLKLNYSGNKNTQNIESQIRLEKATIFDEPALINISAKVENDTVKIDDFSVLPFTGDFSNNLKSNIKGSKKVIITGNIENLKSPIFKNIRIFIPQPLNLTYSDTIAQLKGDIFINGPIKTPEIIGQVHVQNLINQYLQLNINNITADFNKNIAVVNIPSARIGDSSVAINSTVSTDVSRELFIKNINIKSKFIDLDTVLMYKDSPLLKLQPIRIQDGKFYSERATASLYSSPIVLTAVSSDFKLIDNNLLIKNLFSEMYNGKLAGSLEFNLSDESFTSNIQARGVSAAPVFDIIALNRDRMSGTMDFDANLKGNLTTKQSLNGDIKFSIHNGHMGTLGKLEHLLYAQNVIADNMLRTSLSVVTKAITLKDTGLFKYLRGDVTMKDGIANINLLQSQGPSMALYVKGQYNTTTDNAKLTVLGRISDEVVAGLGSFGEFSFNKLMIMLTGNENKLNIKTEDIDKLPQLPIKNTKEFRCIINGIIEKPSSVLQFNWISYSEKSYKTKNTPVDDSKLPDFINNLPY